MPEPGETATDVALRYVRDELTSFRGSMHDELTAIRKDLTSLATELRTHRADQAPRIAVLEHRADQAEKAISDVEQRQREAVQHSTEDRRHERKLRWGVAGALLAALAGWVPDIVQLIMNGGLG